MPGPILTALLGPIFGVVDKVIDRVVVDKEGAEKAKREIQIALVDAQIKGELAQIEVNAKEAENPNVFVSGWRPFIGWVCGAALAFQFVLSPIGVWGMSFFMEKVPGPPSLDNMLWELMFGMLGMGTLRTVEKWKGVASK